MMLHACTNKYPMRRQGFAQVTRSVLQQRWDVREGKGTSYYDAEDSKVWRCDVHPGHVVRVCGRCDRPGTLFTTEVIFGPLAAPDTMWYGVWNVILQGGWTVFNQLPLLFAVSLPIGLANKQNARCCMEALVGYLPFSTL